MANTMKDILLSLTALSWHPDKLSVILTLMLSVQQVEDKCGPVMFRHVM